MSGGSFGTGQAGLMAPAVMVAIIILVGAAFIRHVYTYSYLAGRLGRQGLVSQRPQLI